MATLRFNSFSLFLVLFAILVVATSCRGHSRKPSLRMRATRRASDGRLVPDFIAAFAKLPLIPPYLSPDNSEFRNGVNFASPGAGVLTQTRVGMFYFPFEDGRPYNSTKPFRVSGKVPKTEICDAKTKMLLSKTVYMFSIGSADYITFATHNPTVLPSYKRDQEYVKMVIGNLTTVIQEIHNLGGRKFGFSNLGDLGCSPFLRRIKEAKKNGSVGSMDEVTVLAKLHNQALNRALKKLEKMLQGFNYSVFDFYAATNERINHPSTYGFKEGVVACCGTRPYKGNLTGCSSETVCDNVNEHLFFDRINPTEKANYQFAKLMWSEGADIVKPYNLKTLLKKL